MGELTIKHVSPTISTGQQLSGLAAAINRLRDMGVPHTAVWRTCADGLYAEWETEAEPLPKGSKADA